MQGKMIGKIPDSGIPSQQFSVALQLTHSQHLCEAKIFKREKDLVRSYLLATIRRLLNQQCPGQPSKDFSIPNMWNRNTSNLERKYIDLGRGLLGNGSLGLPRGSWLPSTSSVSRSPSWCSWSWQRWWLLCRWWWPWWLWLQLKWRWWW